MTDFPFETRTCSRCKGSGRYSFNGRHSICYACNGRKVVLTSKGKAKFDAFTAALSVPARDLVAGDKLPASETGRAGWRIVQSVAPTTSPVIINGERVEYVDVRLDGLTLSLPADRPVRKAWSAEHKAAVYARINA